MVSNPDPTIRPTLPEDIEATFDIRARTRQNPITRAQLSSWGITPESVREKYASGIYVGWVCEADGTIVGFCTGDASTGEVLVLAVLLEYEARKIGINLLTRLIETLREKGAARIWLSASPDANIRAHGFYRANGWVPTGEVLDNGDEVLEFANRF